MCSARVLDSFSKPLLVKGLNPDSLFLSMPKTLVLLTISVTRNATTMTEKRLKPHKPRKSDRTLCASPPLGDFAGMSALEAREMWAAQEKQQKGGVGRRATNRSDSLSGPLHCRATLCRTTFSRIWRGVAGESRYKGAV